MNPNISEFSYGYALTDELINAGGFGPNAAPVFPSLIQEGALGYDLKLQSPGAVLFLQFKLSHCMVRNSAKEIKRDRIVPRNTPFYRFYLHRTNHSDQHQLLFDLESTGNDVRYVAPAFHEPAELDKVYLTRTVAANSIFVRPSWIGPIADSEQHHVSFVLNGVSRLYSEPKPIEQDVGFRAFADDAAKSVMRKRQTLSTAIERLPDTMLSIVRQHANTLSRRKSKATLAARVEHVDQRKGALSPVSQLAYLSRTFFGCEPLLIRQRENQTQ